jgi:hypothetical protein
VAEGEYRKFLALRLMYPKADIVPFHLVVEIWREHILDTIAYRDHCRVEQDGDRPDDQASMFNALLVRAANAV